MLNGVIDHVFVITIMEQRQSNSLHYIIIRNVSEQFFLGTLRSLFIVIFSVIHVHIVLDAQFDQVIQQN